MNADLIQMALKLRKKSVANFGGLGGDQSRGASQQGSKVSLSDFVVSAQQAGALPQKENAWYT